MSPKPQAEAGHWWQGRCQEFADSIDRRTNGEISVTPRQVEEVMIQAERKAPQPEDRSNPDDELLALGMLMGVLTQAHDDDRILMHMELAKGAKDYPRLLLRFPKVLGHPYRVELRVVPQEAFMPDPAT